MRCEAGGNEWGVLPPRLDSRGLPVGPRAWKPSVEEPWPPFAPSRGLRCGETVPAPSKLSTVYTSILSLIEAQWTGECSLSNKNAD